MIRWLSFGAGLVMHTHIQAACWQEAGAPYGIDPLLLKAIAWKESRGRADAIGPLLPDGNRALGLLQINTIHLGDLAQFGIGRDDLFKPCVSARVGAWVLSKCIRQFGAVWKAVGCYYTGSASPNILAQQEYVRDVQRYYRGYLRQALAATASPQLSATPLGL